MKWIVPAIIIGLVGGVLDEVTGLHRVWCFLIGVVAFIIYVFMKSVVKTIILKSKSKSA